MASTKETNPLAGGAASNTEEKVYTRGDMAKVLATAKMYKTMYEETDKQVKILREQVKICTDNSLQIANDIVSRVVRLEQQQEYTQGTQNEQVENKKEKKQSPKQDEKQRKAQITEKQAAKDNSVKDGDLKEDATSFMIRGLKGLREYYGAPQADPAQLVHFLLNDTSIKFNKILIADKTAQQKGDRRGARAIIVNVPTYEDKQEAMMKLEKFIAQQRIKEIGICDYFAKSEMDMVKQLERVGAARRRQGGVIRYRVLKKQGSIVLQTLERGGMYKDMEVAEDELAKYVKKT